MASDDVQDEVRRRIAEDQVRLYEGDYWGMIQWFAETVGVRENLDPSVALQVTLLGVFFGFILTFLFQKLKRRSNEFEDTTSFQINTQKDIADLELAKADLVVKKSKEEYYFILLLPFLGVVFYVLTDFDSKFYQEAHIWLPVLSVIGSILFFLPRWNKRSIRKLEQKIKKLQKEIDEGKEKFVERMDPELKDIIKEIVIDEIKREEKDKPSQPIECSEKCQKLTELNTIQQERHNQMLHSLTSFQWCENCIQRQEQICQRQCVKSFFSSLESSMDKFDKQTSEVKGLREEIAIINQVNAIEEHEIDRAIIVEPEEEEKD